MEYSEKHIDRQAATRVQSRRVHAYLNLSNPFYDLILLSADGKRAILKFVLHLLEDLFHVNTRDHTARFARESMPRTRVRAVDVDERRNSPACVA